MMTDMPQAEGAAGGEAAQGETQEKSALEAVLETMPEAVAPEARKDLVEELVKQALEGVVTFDRNITRTIKRAVAALDEKLSKQLAAIMRAPALQKLEGSWRGLHHLVMNSETGTMLKIRVMNVTKKELAKDLDKATEFDQSTLFKSIHTAEFDQPGGQPYGVLIGDYEFSKNPDDIACLEKVSAVGAASFCPFISAASPNLFGFQDFTELPKVRDLKTHFSTKAYTPWNSFRAKEDSRFVTLVMPRVLSRLPYGSETKAIEEFDFEEVELGADGKAREVPHDHFCWMNAAWVYGTVLTKAFAATGWCTTIRGVENGGKVEGLPYFTFTTADGDVDEKCPTEVGIPGRREKELSDLGLLSLGHFKNEDFAVFFGAQTVQKPKDLGTRTKEQKAATENAAISARLPYILASSRIAHYLKMIGVNKIGAFMEADECQRWLTNWIADYVCADSSPSPEVKARFPLAAAKIEVTPVRGKPGAFNATAWLKPWLQLEELNASLRLVTEIPGGK